MLLTEGESDSYSEIKQMEFKSRESVENFLYKRRQ